MRSHIAIILLLAFPAIIFAKGKKCGLPPFVSELPETEQQEVRKIWSNYKDGDNCESLRDRTKAVLDRLTPETRDRIFHHGPPFLRGTSDEVRKQFKDLWNNKSIPYEEKGIKIRELANKLLNKEQLAEFNKFEAKREQMRKEFSEKVSKLSPKAKEAYEKLENLRKEKAKIYEEMSPEVRAEIDQLFSKRFRKNAVSNNAQ